MATVLVSALQSALATNQIAAQRGPKPLVWRRPVRVPMMALWWRWQLGIDRLLVRAMEVTVAGGALLVLAPLLALVACIIRLDGGPVLFWQQRVGKDGRLFAFPKFRSMVVNAEALKQELLDQNQHGGGGVTFKMKRDPRITWIGRFIRRWSIDELPQLWLVVTGQMALVGPRPAVPREVAQYTLADRRRLAARPGITCTWQVSGRAEIPFDQQVDMDHEYIVSRSWVRDLGLLMRTVPAVLTGRGAY